MDCTYIASQDQSSSSTSSLNQQDSPCGRPCKTLANKADSSSTSAKRPNHDMNFQKFSPLMSEKVCRSLDATTGFGTKTPRASLHRGLFSSSSSSEVSTTSTYSTTSSTSLGDESFDDFLHINSEMSADAPGGLSSLLHAPILTPENGADTSLEESYTIKRPSSRRLNSLGLRNRSKRPSPARQGGESPEFKKRCDVTAISKRSHSLELPLPVKPAIKRCQSESDARIKEALDRVNENSLLISDGSKPYCLPTIFGRHQDLTSITPETLARLLNNEFAHVVEKFLIIDCRYPYEFNGGHIEGALNLYTKDKVMDQLMSNPTKSNDPEKRNIIIFHCEFSSERAPRLSRFLRNMDRIQNKDNYPELDYPEVYLLHGGYKSFYESQPEMCSPQSYVPMLHSDFREELRNFRTKSKTWPGEKKSRFSLF